MTTALGLGALVGLGIAIPLGAIGVLLLQTGMLHGWRPAAAGGIGAALVDLSYATAAVLAGGAVSTALAGHERVVGVIGAGVLAAVAVTGVRRVIRDRSAAVVHSVGGSVAPARTLVRFVVLTAVNPLTVVYFAAVAAGFAAELGSASSKAAFVVGIGAASAGWQLLLAAVGTVLGARVGPRVRAVLGVIGYAVVGGFAVALAVR